MVFESNRAPDWKTMVTFFRMRRNSGSAKSVISSCATITRPLRSEEHTSELQSLRHLVCRLLLEKKKKNTTTPTTRNSNHTSQLTQIQSAPHSSTGDGVLVRQSASYVGCRRFYLFFFFFNDTATTEIYTLSLHDALPICSRISSMWRVGRTPEG